MAALYRDPMTDADATRSQKLRVLAVLGVTQLLGWGSVSLLPVLGSRIAADLGMSLPAVFGGSSALYVTMGLAAPAAGRLLRVHGGRRVMACGSMLLAGGLALLATATGPAWFFLAWVVLGVAGAALLTTPAYVYLSQFAEASAKSLIGTLMLVTGLATSLFWPVTAFLGELLGWRLAAASYAAALIAIVPLLLLFGLPETGSAARPEAKRRLPGIGRSGAFWLIVFAVSVNGFVTFGIEAMAIELLKSLGADPVRAVAVASLIGVFKVGGRLLDVLGGQRWDGLTTGLVAGIMMPVGLAVLGLGGVDPWAVGGFLVLFGIGGGAYAVARATMPLVFFGQGDYAAAASALALPLNLIVAAAPPVLALLLKIAGPVEVMWCLVACGTAALCAILLLARMQPPIGPVPG